MIDRVENLSVVAQRMLAECQQEPFASEFRARATEGYAATREAGQEVELGHGIQGIVTRVHPDVPVPFYDVTVYMPASKQSAGSLTMVEHPSGALLVADPYEFLEVTDRLKTGLVPHSMRN